MKLIKTYAGDKAGENEEAKALSKKIKYPAGFESYLTDQVLKRLAIYRVGEKKIFYSCCGKFETYNENRERPRAGRTTVCPYCKRNCKEAPYTTTEIDGAGTLICWTNKSGETLYMAMVDVWRKYKADWENLKVAGDLTVEVEPVALYIASRERQEAFVSYSYQGWGSEGNTVKYMEAPTYDIYINKSSFQRIIPKSFLKYTKTVERLKKMSCQSLVKYIFLAAQYPQVEYLEKMGLGALVDDRIYKSRTYSAVNWRRSNPKEMLGLPKEALREALQAANRRDPARVIATAKRCYKEGWKIKAGELGEVADLLDIVDDKKILAGVTLKKVYRYLDKQYVANMPCCSHGAYGYTRNTVKRDYIDYLREAREIGYDLESEYFRFPKSLPEAHRISGEVLEKKRAAEKKAKSRKEAAELQKKMKNFEDKILKHLLPLEYTSGNLIITAARNEEQLKDESRQLGHCVGKGGGYWKEMIEGKSSIFFVRSTEDPTKSLYTLQLRNKSVVQCRGKSNCNMTEEVNAFVNEWMETIVKGKKKGKVA